MRFYKNPYGSITIINRADGKLFDVAMAFVDNMKNNSELDLAFIDTMGDWRLCPYVEEEGFFSPVIRIDDEITTIDIMFPSSAMCLTFGTKKAVEKFVTSLIKVSPEDYIEESSKLFMEDYEKNCEAVKDIYSSAHTEAYEKCEAKEEPEKSSNQTLKNRKQDPITQRRIYKLGKASDVLTYMDVAKNFYIYKKTNY